MFRTYLIALLDMIGFSTIWGAVRKHRLVLRLVAHASFSNILLGVRCLFDAPWTVV